MTSKITKKLSVSAKGILDITDGVMSIEIEDDGTSKMVDLAELCAEFANRDVSFSLTYNEDYE